MNTMKYDLHDKINHKYFNYEFEQVKYLKQRIVMQIYNELRFFGRTLKDVWNQVNIYFHNLNNSKHTCNNRIEIDPYRGSISGVTYWGD